MTGATDVTETPREAERLDAFALCNVLRADVPTLVSDVTMAAVTETLAAATVSVMSDSATPDSIEARAAA